MAETSKKRTVRIPLDYYKRPDRFAWWRRVLSGLAALLAVAWAVGFGWDFWSPARWAERTRGLASHGPLTRSHATWEMECDVCHTPFRPVGVETWPAPILGDAQTSSQKCQACHAAGDHHGRQQPPSSQLACASCHHDHQGPDASLVRGADQQCTQCHARLTAHVEGGETNVAASVTRFDASAGSHPPFQTKDTGHLKFNHSRHLNPGMSSEKFGKLQTLDMIHEADRGRYEKYASGTQRLIQLDCAACHELSRDDTGGPAPTPPPRGGPAYMLPINYQNHCRGCHPLRFDPSSDALVMDHPLQLADVEASLWRTYTVEYLKENPNLLDQWIPPRPLPGKTETPALVNARAAVERKVADAETVLYAGKKCTECHDYEDAKGKGIAVLNRFNPADPARVRATNVPVVWWRSAAFTHSAHRGVSCRGCHENAYPDSKQASHQSADVLLPDMAVCLQCHAPRGHGIGVRGTSGGAGFKCTECHRYHDGDLAIQGRTPLPAPPATRLTIEEFLLGKPANTQP